MEAAKQLLSGVVLAFGIGACALPSRYFPNQSFSADWIHAKRLRDAGESPLRKVDAAEAYRVFAADPATSYIVRVEAHGGTFRLHSRREVDQMRERTRLISATEWNRISELLQQADYWNTPTEPPDDVIQLDGSMCDIEGTRDHEYHVVTRKTFTTSPQFSELCLYILSLADISMDFTPREPSPRAIRLN